MLVPIYQYHGNPGSGTVYYYTTDSNLGSPWTPDGIAFYGCESSDSGAVPVYMYLYGNEDSAQLWYSTDAHGGGDGWNINVTGPVFYALPSSDSRGKAVHEWISETPHTHYYGGSDSTWLAPPTGSNWTDNSSQGAWFYAVPVNLALNYVIQSVNYPQPVVNNLKVTPFAVATQELKNESKTLPSTQSVTLTKSLTNTYTLTLTDTFSMGVTVGGELGVPGAKVSASVTASMSLGQSNAWTSTTTETISATGSVTLPPLTNAIYTITATQARNASVPCTILALASYPAMSADEVQMVFQGQNPSFSGTTTPLPNHNVRIQMKGTVTGTWRTDLVTDLTDANGDQYNGDLAVPTPTVTPG